MKGQVAIEYIILIGILLFITIPIFYYTLNQSKESTRISQAYDAVNAIANTADSVYALGPGNKRYIWVSMPSGVDSAEVENNEVVISLDVLGSSSDFVGLTNANLTAGSLSTEEGSYRLEIEMLDTGQVSVS